MDYEFHHITMAEYTDKPKPMVVVRCASGTGFKARAHLLVEALGGRYVNRRRGYLMTPRRFAEFEAKYAQGWDAGYGVYKRGELIAPETPEE